MAVLFLPSLIVAFVMVTCTVGDSWSHRQRSRHDRYDAYDSKDYSYYDAYEPTDRRNGPYRSHRPVRPPQTTDIQLLHLDEGDFCRRRYGLEPDYVCQNAKKCIKPLTEAVKNGYYLDVCSFDGTQMVVCCPSSVRETLPDHSRPTTDKIAPVTRPPPVAEKPPPTKTTRPTTAKRTRPTTAKGTRPTTAKGTTPATPHTTVTPPTTARGTTAGQRTKTTVETTRPTNVPGTNIPAPATGKPPIAPSASTTIATDDRIQNANTAVERCRQYNELLPKSHYASIEIGDGTAAKPLEFPHMALLGYGETTESRDDWKCGGSLVSERWILTVANCMYRSGSLARWARLGDFDIQSTTDFAQPRDYEIIEHVPHPDYERSKRYNDIALFQLDTAVEFSVFVRPICLNSDPSWNPSPQIATGWGAISTDGGNSDTLLKVTLDIVPTDLCNASYFSNDSPELKYGITPDTMICGGAIREDEDACQGFSGGPLQTRDGASSALTYTQFGITSFGSSFCGVKESPGVYTRVAKYVPWIEETAF